MFSLQLSSHIKHYQLSLHASSLWSILSFPRGCLLFGFHFICVYDAFCLVLLFVVAFGTPLCFCARVQSHISISIGIRDVGQGGGAVDPPPQFGQIRHLFGQKITHLFDWLCQQNETSIHLPEIHFGWGSKGDVHLVLLYDRPKYTLQFVNYYYGNVKRTWQILREALNSQIIINKKIVVIGNIETSNKKDIANRFNTLFARIRKTVNFFLQRTHQEELMKVAKNVKKLKQGKASITSRHLS